MNRRKFLRNTALLSGAGLPFPTWGKEAAPASWQHQFAQALQQTPWLAAFRTAGREEYDAALEVTGSWPEALSGTLFRNGPARHEIGDFRYQHWFDGDGLVHAYTMTPAGVRHRARFVSTFKSQAEAEAQRALYPGFATLPPDPAPVTSPDTVNPANISVLHHHGKLLALWEAGSPWEIDSNTLETKGLYQFSDHTRGVPFSAHPRVEPDGTLWNFGYLSLAGIFVLWHIDANGRIVKMGKIPAQPITMVHDFIVTSRHIVLMVPPLHYQPEGATSFLHAHQWHPEDPTRILVIDKNDFDKHFWLELPAQWLFHFGNGWEDAAGVIRFDGARAADPLAMMDSFHHIMRGEVKASSASHHHAYRVDTKARTISEAPMFPEHIDSEFPCIDPRVSCRQNHRLFMLSQDRRAPSLHINLNEVSSINLDSGRRDSFRYLDTQIPEEHLFVEQPGSQPEADGWVIGTALDWQAGCHLLNVFHANDLNAGPVASAKLPYMMPMGLHGKFVHG